MKKIIVIALSLCISHYLIAQKMSTKDVPAPVKAGFDKQFPLVSKVKWEKEKEHYEAEFEMNKTETSALFDASGKWLETETEIKVNELPPGVLEYVKANYKGQKIREAAKITDASGKVVYEAEIKEGDLLFDQSGKFIQLVKD